MPICLNCGKNIHGDHKYCDECAGLIKYHPPGYLDITKSAKNIQQGKSKGHLWIMAGSVLILMLLISLGWVMISMFPTEEIAKKQAELCRERIRELSIAVSYYVKDKNSLPPEGKVDSKHPLVTEGFLKSALRCPRSRHYYVIEYSGGRAVITCDTKLKSHEFK